MASGSESKNRKIKIKHLFSLTDPVGITRKDVTDVNFGDLLARSLPKFISDSMGNTAIVTEDLGYGGHPPNQFLDWLSLFGALDKLDCVGQGSILRDSLLEPCNCCCILRLQYFARLGLLFIILSWKT